MANMAAEPRIAPADHHGPSPSASFGSIRGLHYVAADGTRIPNVGQQLVKFMTLDGTWTEILFQIAAINKPLMSVSTLNEAGYKVIFDDNNSYILHKKTKCHEDEGGAGSVCHRRLHTCARSLRQVSAGCDRRDTSCKLTRTDTHGQP